MLQQITQKQYGKIRSLCDHYSVDPFELLAGVEIDPEKDDSETNSLAGSVSVSLPGLYCVVLTDGSSHS